MVAAGMVATLRAMSRPLSPLLLSTVLAAVPAVGGVLIGCNSPRPAEIGEGPCSNGLDDDGDGLIDCADPACRLFAWCTTVADASQPDASQPDAGSLDADLDAEIDATLTCTEPLDLVLVLDVSSSMTADLAQLRDLAPALFASAQAASPQAHVSMVVFVDDALAVDGCAPFASADALAASLEQWRAFTSTNRSPVSDLENVDCPENSLDAIATALTTCAWRTGSRVILHVTDDTFAERPSVLSGPFGPGVLVMWNYIEVSSALARQGVSLLALTANGPGTSCGGPTTSPDVGRGFHTPFGSDVSLPDRTGGRAWDLRAMRDGSFALVPALDAYLAQAVCAP